LGDFVVEVGRHTVSVVGRLIDVRMQGYGTRAELVALLAHVDSAIERSTGPCVLVRDTTELEAWEPGTPGLSA
jgi:hypothetical protein